MAGGLVCIRNRQGSSPSIINAMRCRPHKRNAEDRDSQPQTRGWMRRCVGTRTQNSSGVHKRNLHKANSQSSIHKIYQIEKQELSLFGNNNGNLQSSTAKQQLELASSLLENGWLAQKTNQTTAARPFLPTSKDWRAENRWKDYGTQQQSSFTLQQGRL